MFGVSRQKIVVYRLVARYTGLLRLITMDATKTRSTDPAIQIARVTRPRLQNTNPQNSGTKSNAGMLCWDLEAAKRNGGRDHD